MGQELEITQKKHWPHARIVNITDFTCKQRQHLKAHMLTALHSCTCIYIPFCHSTDLCLLDHFMKDWMHRTLVMQRSQKN